MIADLAEWAQVIWKKPTAPASPAASAVHARVVCLDVPRQLRDMDAELVPPLTIELLVGRQHWQRLELKRRHA